MNIVARHIIFGGRVQGVGFRYTARDIARQRGIKGYVRNLSDGTVEMFAQGLPAAIDDCIADIRGSFGPYVRDVQIDDATADERYRDFIITF